MSRRVFTQFVWLLVLFAFTTAPSRATQPGSSSATAAGSDVLWNNPGPPENLDFVGGIGGRENAPKPPFTFVEEDSAGSNPKVKVKDANGRKWTAKWGTEVNAEVFASRIAWAAGYIVEPSYYVPSGKIVGITKLDRAKEFVGPDGSFHDSRFEGKTESTGSLKGEESWRWDQNPFLGTRELDGLKVVMMLVSNWDNKDQRDAGRGSNTAIYQVQTKSGAQNWYVVTDWGGAMGKWGGVFKREKWDAKGYADQSKDFLKQSGGKWEFGYSGQHSDDFKRGINPANVSWIAKRLSRITDKQLADGLKAAGATGEEVAIFTRGIRERLTQLSRVQ